MTQNVRVFIIDDHPVVRAGLRDLLRASRGITVVGDAEDGEAAALTALESSGATVAIVDIKLKRGDGIDVCRRIKSQFPEVGVALLSAFWDDGLVRSALDAGADGYLLKDAEHFDLEKAIRSVARGESFFDTAISGALSRRVREGNAGDSLSTQDAQILRHVADGRTNKAIAASLFLSPHTVRDRLSGVMTLLGAKNRAEAVQIASRRGLI